MVAYKKMQMWSDSIWLCCKKLTYFRAYLLKRTMFQPIIYISKDVHQKTISRLFCYVKTSIPASQARCAALLYPWLITSANCGSEQSRTIKL